MIEDTKNDFLRFWPDKYNCVYMCAFDSFKMRYNSLPISYTFSLDTLKKRVQV